jgi:hypothetical protein
MTVRVSTVLNFGCNSALIASEKNAFSFEVSPQRGKCEKKGSAASSAETRKKDFRYAGDCSCRFGRYG